MCTYPHTSAVQQGQMPVSDYRGQTNMVGSASFYGTPHTNDSSNIQQGGLSIYLSADNSQYVVTPQNMPVNEKIGHANSSYQASYSQPSYAAQNANRVEFASTFSAPYVNANNHDLASNVHSNYSQVNGNSANIHIPPQADQAYTLSNES